MRWGNGEAALALTIKMGTGEGCGAWLGHGVKRAAEHVGKGSDEFAVHVHGGEPAYHDSRFTSLMGVTYIADPTPGRHTAGSASWNETFGVGFSLPKAADKKDWNVEVEGHRGQGHARRRCYSNAHQAMNGLGLCMFTMLTGSLPWTELVNAATGWDVTDADLLALRRAHPEPARRVQPPRGHQARRLHSRTRACSAKATATSTAGPLKGITRRRCRCCATTTTPRCTGTRTTGNVTQRARDRARHGRPARGLHGLAMGIFDRLRGDQHPRSTS